jgi:hypothetical protein
MTFHFTQQTGAPDVQWPNKQPGDVCFSSVSLQVMKTLFKAMGNQIKEGRAFSKDFGADTTSFIINEEAAKRMD